MARKRNIIIKEEVNRRRRELSKGDKLNVQKDTPTTTSNTVITNSTPSIIPIVERIVRNNINEESTSICLC